MSISSSLVNSEIDELFHVVQAGRLHEGRQILERVLDDVNDLDQLTQAAAYARLESVAEMYGIRLPRVEQERVERKEKEREEESAFRPGMEYAISLDEIQREDFIQIAGTSFDANQFIRGVLCRESASNPFTTEELSNDQIRALLDHFGLNDVSVQSFKDIWEDARRDFEEELTSETFIHQNDEDYQLGRLVGQDVDGANADRRRDFRIRRFLGLFAGKDSERAMVKLIRLSESVPPQMMGRFAFQPQRRREPVLPRLV